MRTLSLISILLMTLGLAQTGSAQTNRRKPPTPAPVSNLESVPVSVVLKDGQTLKGKFLSANSKKLSIIIGSSTQEINMSEVASLIFADTYVAATTSVENASTSAALEAIKALHKLESATSAGVTRAEYGTRLIDAKASVDELLPRVSAGDLKSEVEAAMREFVSAGEIWQLLYEINVKEINDGRGVAGTIIDVPKWVTEKYNLKPDDPGGSEQMSFGTVHHPPRYLTSSILSTVWRSAKEHLEKAAQLAK